MSEIKPEIYSEVIGVLFALGNEYVKKLPSTMMPFLLDNCDFNNIPKFDKNVRIEDQKISDEARMILVAIKIKYWCNNQKERNEVLNLMKVNEQEFIDTINEKYSDDKLVKNYDLSNVLTELEIVKEKGPLGKLWDKIKRLFKR